MIGGRQRGNLAVVANVELGSFLRSRREAVKPADVGLPHTDRRRTPGLRRSELATLAGVSVEYLTRLEQGRDQHPSAPVLTAIADTLRLSAEDRVQLGMLAKAAGGAMELFCPVGRPSMTIRPTVRALLDRLEPGPALVVNQLNDVLAYTDGFARLTSHTALLAGDPPNLIRFVLSDPAARELFPDWEQAADQQGAVLAQELARSNPAALALADELGSQIPAALGQLRPSGVQRWSHPEVGEFRLTVEALDLPEADAQRLLVYFPADDTATKALDTLVGRRPGHLRTVTA